MITTVLTWIGVFLTYVVLDIVWAFYTVSLANKQRMRASIWAAIIPMMTAILTLQYIVNPWLIIPGAIGGFVGTWASFWIMDHYEQ